jgi:hypothetical protein
VARSSSHHDVGTVGFPSDEAIGELTGAVTGGMTGLTVGFLVGFRVGGRVGFGVAGLIVGFLVGRGVTGLKVGLLLGREVTGLKVGLRVGRGVTGLKVGLRVGRGVTGFGVGLLLGFRVGLLVGGGGTGALPEHDDGGKSELAQICSMIQLYPELTCETTQKVNQMQECEKRTKIDRPMYPTFQQRFRFFVDWRLTREYTPGLFSLAHPTPNETTPTNSIRPFML